MPVPFATGLRTRVVFTGDAKATIITQIRQTLVDVGWSGAVGDEYHNSVITPQGLQCRVRVHDDGGNCAVVQFRNVPETQIGSQHFLLPKAAPVEYCIIANQHQFFVFVINQAAQPRTYVGGGVPFMDPPLYNPVRYITEAVWSNGNGLSDTDVVGVGASFRNATMATKSWQETNGIYSVVNHNVIRVSTQCILVKAGLNTIGDNAASEGFMHHGGQSNKVQARIMWGRVDADGNPPGSYRRIMGTLWDAVAINSPPASPIVGDSLETFDNYKWHCITSPVDFVGRNAGGNACLFITYEAVP